MLVENALIVLIVIGVAIVTDVVILLLAKIFPRYRPTEIKLQRFEAGNPPVATPKWVFPMQYLGFMLMFMAAEPVMVLLFLLATNPTIDVMALTTITFVLLIPALVATYNYSLDIANLKRVKRMRGGAHG